MWIRKPAEVRDLLGRLEGSIMVLAGPYEKGADDFIEPGSPAGKLLTMGWKAVPPLLDALENERLEVEKCAGCWHSCSASPVATIRAKRAFLEVTKVRGAAWHVYGGRDGLRDTGGSGWSDDGRREGKIDAARQREFARNWQRFRDFIIVCER